MSRLRPWVGAASFVCMLAAQYMAFLYAPTEPNMQMAQRIFYFHVPAAITAFLAFALVFICSVAYLKTEARCWDRVAYGAAEIGVLLSVIVLVTGPIWAKPVWGVYWRWEPRLTSMLVLFCMYAAYLMVRRYGTDDGKTPRLAAVLGIVAFANVPLVYFSVNMWAADQQLHPQRVELAPEMRATLWVAMAAFMLLFIVLLDRNVRLQLCAERVSDLRDAQNRDAT
jgi:heme exporter protein C